MKLKSVNPMWGQQYTTTEQQLLKGINVQKQVDRIRLAAEYGRRNADAILYNMIVEYEKLAGAPIRYVGFEMMKQVLSRRGIYEDILYRILASDLQKRSKEASEVKPNA